jgi:hypothetical protein
MITILYFPSPYSTKLPPNTFCNDGRSSTLLLLSLVLKCSIVGSDTECTCLKLGLDLNWKSLHKDNIGFYWILCVLLSLPYLFYYV